MGIIGFIFFFILFLLLVLFIIGLAVLKGVLHFLGFGKSSRNSSGQKESYYGNGSQKESNSQQSAATGKKKIFDKDEGEYVDFEEVKE